MFQGHKKYLIVRLFFSDYILLVVSKPVFLLLYRIYLVRILVTFFYYTIYLNRKGVKNINKKKNSRNVRSY